MPTNDLKDEFWTFAVRHASPKTVPLPSVRWLGLNPTHEVRLISPLSIGIVEFLEYDG